MIDKNLVFVVDDEPSIRELYSRMIEQLFGNLRVISFENAEVALAQIEQGLLPVLVLTDFKMPLMDGVEFARRVKRDHPEVKIILMTGYYNGFGDEASGSLFAEVLLKPIRMDILRHLLSNYLPTAL